MIDYIKVKLYGNRVFIHLLLIAALVLADGGILQATDLHPEAQHQVVARVLTRLVTSQHYSKKPLDDKASSEIFDAYLEFLDPNRSYFLASDLQKYEKYRYALDDHLQEARLEPAYEIFNDFVGRVDQRIDFVVERLNTPFELDREESFVSDRSEASWAETAEELNEIWRKRLKNEMLNLKLAGRPADSAAVTLSKRYSNFKKQISQNTSEDVFQIFMNAVTQYYDPHSDYMSPTASDNFDIQMSLSLQGIGAQLTSDFDYTKVVRILPGGPADRSRELWPNDRIVGVAQGHDGPMLDVIGMRLDDVVQKIRGEKGTLVRLEVLPAGEMIGGNTKLLSLVRDKIVLTEREAKSDTFEIMHENRRYKLGIIEVPTFYADLAAQNRGEKDYKSTTRDVRARLRELQRANIDGLIIDLRNNSGGSLQEAVELTGLFIESGPVVQVRDSNNRIRVLKDRDGELVYDGPLAVMVNRRSASASEIFAGAIQDYDRGVVLGDQTFGKGTVQQLYGFDRFIQTVDPALLGQIKLTVAKFYRVAGSSTQQRGVTPDILFPSVLTEMDFGEDKEKHALPWDQIESAGFTSWGQVSQYLPHLRLKSEQRVARNPEFGFIKEDIQLYKDRLAIKAVSLNEQTRRKEKERQDEEGFKRNNARRAARGLPPLKKGEEEPRIENPPPDDDPLVAETGHVLSDLINLSRPIYQGKVEEK